MRVHDPRKGGLSGGVERGRRLVEQPQRPMGDEKAGERDAPFLAGGEQARGKVDRMRKAEARQRRALARNESPPSAAQKARFSPAVSAPFTASAWPR